MSEMSSEDYEAIERAYEKSLVAEVSKLRVGNGDESVVVR